MPEPSRAAHEGSGEKLQEGSAQYGLRVRWKNFRGFEDTGWLRLAPLTIIIGPNNAGKTSLIAPLLLLKQTWESMSDQPLITNGDYINAGLFSDFVFQHDTRRNVSLGFRWHAHRRTQEAMASDLGSYPPGGCIVDFGSEKPTDIELRRYQVVDALGRSLLIRRQTERGSYSVAGIGRILDGTDREVSGSLTDRAIRRAIRRDKPMNFLFRGSDIFSRALRDLHGDKVDEEFEASDYSTLYARIADFSFSGATELLSLVNYIGPIRARPRRLYELSGEIPSEVGMTGGLAPEMLFRGGAPELSRVRRWLRRFGYSGQLRTNHLTESAFNLCLVSEEGGSTNFADTGFGLSQVLPLIVQGIYGEPGSVILAEQPEIHLNPAMQSTLADLFCELATSDKRVVVETHSEHLLLRVRRLVAEGVIEASQVSLFFVERTEEKATVRPIPISDTGDIGREAWPAGFFEEALDQSLGLAMAQGARLKRASRSGN